MNIVSIYPHPMDDQYRHDHNVTMIKDKEIYSYEEAKLKGSKNDDASSFPIRSIFMGFKQLKITPRDIDFWVFPQPSKKMNYKTYKFFFVDFFKSTSEKNLKRFLKEKVIFVKHHEAHVYTGFFSSNFDQSDIISIDGGGDMGDERRMLWGNINIKNSKLFKKYGETFNSAGLGVGAFHNHLTDLLGFYDNNGKTSGLASYGKLNKKLYKNLKKLFIYDWSKNNIKFSNKRSKSNERFSKIKIHNFEAKKYLKTSPVKSQLSLICKNFKPQDVAKTGEILLQDLTIEMINRFFKNSKAKNLICVGGLFNNVALNNFISNKSGYQKTFFSMSPGDSGLSLGMALYLKKIKGKIKTNLSNSEHGINPFLGPSFNENEIKEILENSKIKYKKISSYKKLNSVIVNKIIKGKIVGLFRDKAEFGPRSLGARSILADPRNIKSKQRVNQLIKRRDWFMPYAPSVINERFNDYFGHQGKSQYMQLTQKVTKKFLKIAPAACHVDGTSRSQIVIKNNNHKYYDLIKKFGDKTGCYSLLNTSFNRHGIATISSPKQAVEHLLDGTVEILVLNDFLIELENNRRLKKRFKNEINLSEKSLLTKFEKNFKKTI